LKLLPRTLFGRTAATLLAVFLLFEAVAFAVAWTQVVEPLTRRAADDLAAKILLAAQTWVELPPETRADYESELSFRHGLELGLATDRLMREARHDYFLSQIEVAMGRRAGHSVRLMEGPDPAWAWADLQVGDKILRVGFERESYVFAAPLVAAGVLLLGAVLTIAAALFMVLRASRQLKGLAAKAQEVGQGRAPVRLPEQGAQELRDLTAAFNRMAEEVTALLENRTVLLAGISHDLRTPITRLRLALSMLDEVDAGRVARMERDLDEMNRLITDMLSFARAFRQDEGKVCDLVELLDELVGQARQLGVVEWTPPPPCPVRLSDTALRRVVGNLLDNARRYGGDEPVRLALEADANVLRIRVSDRGPGIASEHHEAVFRPFFRLEGSRSKDGGGSGLGLAIARQLADAQGWRIELAENRADQRVGGLAASVVLPATVRESSMAAAGSPR
jgi:two-component system osmolarity sensor histidine kinase EnvZ